MILTSEGCAEHPFAGQNTQQLFLYSLSNLLCQSLSNCASCFLSVYLSSICQPLNLPWMFCLSLSLSLSYTYTRTKTCLQYPSLYYGAFLKLFFSSSGVVYFEQRLVEIYNMQVFPFLWSPQCLSIKWKMQLFRTNIYAAKHKL